MLPIGRSPSFGGGENVYPAEVESVLYEHPAIAQVAVIGVPDQRWGERVAAVVVLKPGQSVDLDGLRAYCESRLARYKLPGALFFMDELPLNSSGKLLKTELRKRFGTPL
jgi:fatty-acyl-CoA synthase